MSSPDMPCSLSTCSEILSKRGRGKQFGTGRPAEPDRTLELAISPRHRMLVRRNHVFD